MLFWWVPEIMTRVGPDVRRCGGLRTALSPERRPRLPAEAGTTPAAGKCGAARSEIPLTSAGPYSITFPRTIACGSYPGSSVHPLSRARFPRSQREWSTAIEDALLTRNGYMATDIYKRDKGVRVGVLVSGRNL